MALGPASITPLDSPLSWAGFLSTLGKAQLGLGEFVAAEANLLEAHTINAEHRSLPHKRTIKRTQAIVDLYTAWNEAEPDQGYWEKAAEWKGKLDAVSESRTGDDPKD